MINLNNKKDIRYFIKLIEKISIETLKEFNIESRSYDNRIGVWVTKFENKFLKKEKKIGSIGIRIKKWVTFHGASFNIYPDLKYFKLINPCGLKNYDMTSLKDLGINASFEDFDNFFIKNLNKYLII